MNENTYDKKKSRNEIRISNIIMYSNMMVMVLCFHEKDVSENRKFKRRQTVRNCDA